MKILLSYSKPHFDPALPQEKHKYWGHSAQILAKTLFETFSSYGEVTYADQTEYELYTGKEFDFYIGIIGTFEEFASRVKAKTKILFTVNTHPKKQFMLMQEAFPGKSKDEILASSHISKKVLLTSQQLLQEIDFILGVGNNFTLQSFLDSGVPFHKCKLLNYGLETAVEPACSGQEQSIVFSYIASDIGPRKGFDSIVNVFSSPQLRDENFFLNIAGKIHTQAYQKKLDGFLCSLDSKVRYHGWLRHDSQEYIALMQNTDIMLCPSFEEGQVGTLVEAMGYGIIPIGTERCGIDYFPLGRFEPVTKSQANLDIILSVLRLNQTALAHVKEKTFEYYSIFHSGFKESFRKTIDSIIIHNQIYPLISIILPIFNKQDTIIPLLYKLHSCCLSYKNVEVHVLFDGCVDKTEEIVRGFYKNRGEYPVTFEVTPDIFEVKTNNIGLKKSKGDYCIIIQDDTYIDDLSLFAEAITFLEKAPKVAILGCLAGVNFYPRGTEGLVGNGQIQMTPYEVYWRQDATTDPVLQERFFEVDACMRGPLIIRREFLLQHGYLDEIYAPLYNDDMDICFRAREKGYRVFAMLGSVRNAGLTMAKCDKKKWAFFDKIIKRNTENFYSRYTPSLKKDYLRVFRVPLRLERKFKDTLSFHLHNLQTICCAPLQSLRSNYKKMKDLFRKTLHKAFPVAEPVHNWQVRIKWLEQALTGVLEGARILDAGAGKLTMKPYCKHLQYISQDFAQYDGKGDAAGMQSEGWEYPSLDIVSDICSIPEPDESFDAILCTEVFEHLPNPIATLQEFNRLLRPSGELILTAPFCSCSHFSPYFFHTGFSRYWYEKHLPKSGFIITELTPNGNFHSYLLQELHRTPEMLNTYTNIRASLVERLALYITKSLFSRALIKDTKSQEFLCFGYHVRAKKR